MERSALLQHRIVFLSESIEPETSNLVIAQLLLLDAANHAERIDLYVNSPGGSVTDGLAILDTIACIQAPVSTTCIGQASSFAAWIVAAGTKGLRFATPNSELMIHQAMARLGGKTSDIEIHTQRLTRIEKRMVELLSEYTGQPCDKIREDMRRDYFMTAQEAKAYGIVDEVLQPFRTKSLETA